MTKHDPILEENILKQASHLYGFPPAAIKNAITVRLPSVSNRGAVDGLYSGPDAILENHVRNAIANFYQTTEPTIAEAMASLERGRFEVTARSSAPQTPTAAPVPVEYLDCAAN